MGTRGAAIIEAVPFVDLERLNMQFYEDTMK